MSQKFNFNDQSESQGLIFHHDHGGSGERYYIVTIGLGVSLFDYDNENDLDVYFCQGSPFPGWNKNINLENKLFRYNNGKWTDVTSIAGVGDASYSFRCAFEDIDNDGDIDIVVAKKNGPANLLLRQGVPHKSWIGFNLMVKKQIGMLSELVFT